MFDPGRIESLEFQVRALKRMLFGVFALFSLFLVGGVVAATTLPRVPEVVRGGSPPPGGPSRATSATWS